MGGVSSVATENRRDSIFRSNGEPNAEQKVFYRCKLLYWVYRGIRNKEKKTFGRAEASSPRPKIFLCYVSLYKPNKGAYIC